VIISILILNHLKNNSKILVEIFCQFKKKLYFCTRFQNERAQRKRLKIFLKKIWSIGKKVVPLHPQKWRVKKRDREKIFEKRFGQLKKRLYLCTRKQSD